MQPRRIHTVLLAACVLSAAAPAAIVRVEIRGHVEWNDFTTGTLAPVRPGEDAFMAFEVDSAIFTNNPNFPTRGYPPRAGTFRFTLGGVNVPLAPAPNPPYWVIRNNDPGVDGFVFSTNLNFPVEVPVSIGIPNYGVTFLRTFNNGTALPSLDILDAVGSWGLENLSSYDFTIQRGEFSTPLGIAYTTLSITAVTPPCPTDIDDGSGTGTPDGGVTIDDLLYYLTLFDQGAPAADFDDGSGTGTRDGGVTIDDLLYFLARFEEGC